MNGFRLDVLSLERRDVPSAGLGRPPAAEFAVRAAVSAPTPQQQLRTALDAVRRQADLPALAAGFVADGVTAVAATGVRERGGTAAVTAADQYHLGSNGKAMTATLAATLVERGYLRWSTTVGELFPALKARISETFAKATLEQLLNHRSGIVDENVPDEFLTRAAAYRGSAWIGRQLIVPAVLAATPAGTPGEFRYSNVGYTVAGWMLEKATGNTFEWLMQKHVFIPLGMTSAGFGPPGSRALDQPRGHDPLTGKSVGNGPRAELPRLLSPAGLMHMSVSDWAKFLRVHLGETVNGVTLLSRRSLDKLHTADPRPVDESGLTYGFGWVHETRSGRDILWHNGTNGFWFSEAVLDLKAKTAAFAVTNTAGDPAVLAVDGLVRSVSARR